MQTSFKPEALQLPAMQASEKILRTCVHCGFCTATCPTYLLLGDELDSPRGRIYMIKDMLERGRPATKDVVTHIDRCLSCLSCMTTCPSGVHYMHLIDHARAHIEATYTRPLGDRLIRAVLAFVLPYPTRFRFALFGARFAKVIAPLIRALPAIGKKLGAMIDLAPITLPARSRHEASGVIAAETPRRGRIALLGGCAQTVLDPGINEATIRLLTRMGFDVVRAKGEGCCGALVHHMGRDEESHHFAKANIDAWVKEIDGEGLDAIAITTSGCGTTIKDYGFMFRNDPAYAEKAARISALAKDITEIISQFGLPEKINTTGQVIAYHSACSMQHGQQIKDEPKNLLKAAGFVVKDVPEGHICCGSAGTYNMMQPELSGALRERKVDHIERTRPEIVATGNLGCMTQIGKGLKDRQSDIRVVHTIELLDWATGGPLPRVLADPGFH